METVKEKNILKRKQRRIEHHLKNYHQYKIGINNLRLQLDSIMPDITVSYEVREGSVGTFTINAPTEKYAIDRIESKRVLDLNEQLERYQLIVDCIDSAIDVLDRDEQQFVENRYFNNYNHAKMMATFGMSESTIFRFRTKVMNQLMISLAGIIEL